MERTARQVGRIVESSIPARLDALPWSRFHTLVIVALGITWILDGLEVTLAGAVSGALKASPSLRLSDAQVGLSASAYLTGAVLGALLFGWLTDRFGRKRLFFMTLGVYVLATAATAFSAEFRDIRAFPLPDRRRNRRRVLGDQFGDPGADPSTLSRSHRSRRQWKFLGGRRTRRDRLQPVAAAWTPSSRRRLAIGIRIGCGTRSRHPFPEAISAGKPALAVAARADRRSRTHRRRGGTRSAWPRHRVGIAAPAAPADPRAHRELRRSRRHAFSALPAQGGARSRAHDRAGFLLQRDFLHLCAGAGSLLCCGASGRGTLSVAIRREQFPRSSDSRPLLRYLGPPTDDRHDLCALGLAARPDGHSLRLPAC